MAFKLLAMAHERWRRINGANRVSIVRGGVGFIDGMQSEGRTAA